jgi:predicted N-acetyltransferase YhbS
MMNDIRIEDLSRHTNLIPLLAHLHFEQWGALTGASSGSDYEVLLGRHASAPKLPLTLVALSHDGLIGSTNVVDCDMAIRSDLTPWLAQLYVLPKERGRGIGSALVQAALARSRELGFQNLYLYTSGTLPIFYERIGWTTRETVQYKGKERIIMEMRLPVNK